MSHAEREKVMAQVEEVLWGKRLKLGELGIPKTPTIDGGSVKRRSQASTSGLGTG